MTDRAKTPDSVSEGSQAGTGLLSYKEYAEFSEKENNNKKDAVVQLDALNGLHVAQSRHGFNKLVTYIKIRILEAFGDRECRFRLGWHDKKSAAKASAHFASLLPRTQSKGIDKNRLSFEKLQQVVQSDVFENLRHNQQLAVKYLVLPSLARSANFMEGMAGEFSEIGLTRKTGPEFEPYLSVYNKWVGQICADSSKKIATEDLKVVGTFFNNDKIYSAGYLAFTDMVDNIKEKQGTFVVAVSSGDVQEMATKAAELSLELTLQIDHSSLSPMFLWSEPEVTSSLFSFLAQQCFDEIKAKGEMDWENFVAVVKDDKFQEQLKAYVWVVNNIATKTDETEGLAEKLNIGLSVHMTKETNLLMQAVGPKGLTSFFESLSLINEDEQLDDKGRALSALFAPSIANMEKPEDARLVVQDKDDLINKILVGISVSMNKYYDFFGNIENKRDRLI